MMSQTVYKVFPAVGIARVGNSPDAYYIGPETYCGLPTCADDPKRPFTPADFRDAQGRMARQAALFHVYRSVNGAAYEEVTLDSGDIANIQWQVHVANKKATWYQFMTSKGETGYASDHPVRNPDVLDTAKRQALMIDPGPRSIAGRAQSGVQLDRNSIPVGYAGNFPPEDLKPFPINTLGELKTDSSGRLLFLGGLGHSGSDKTPNIVDYANNNNWWDDTSDGPVRATITLNSGEVITAEPAWVMTAPPKYVPQIANVVSLYDTIFDASVRYMNARPDIYAEGFWKRGEQGYRPNFTRDILPIFERAEAYPWVAAIPPKPHTFDYARLGNPDVSCNGLRHYYLSYLRKPSYPNTLISPRTGGTLMPYLAGDDCFSSETMDESATNGTSQYSTLTDTQYFFLQQWADGFFDAGPAPQENPAFAMTRGVLENCVGGPFSPGIEMTWISRHAEIYSEPFRIKARDHVSAPLSLGYTPELGMEPGDVCRYMALPWQADFNECSSQGIGTRTLWWWPAQRPEYVYLAETQKEPRQARQVPWVGTDLNQKAADYIMFADDLVMVSEWSKLGFVYDVGKNGKAHFVEVSRTLPRPGYSEPAADAPEPGNNR